jgi:AAA domain
MRTTKTPALWGEGQQKKFIHAQQILMDYPGFRKDVILPARRWAEKLSGRKPTVRELYCGNWSSLCRRVVEITENSAMEEGKGRVYDHIKKHGLTYPVSIDAAPESDEVTPTLGDYIPPQFHNAGVGDLLKAEPPPREYLIPGFLPLSIVAILAAAGGVGKSNYLLALSMSLAAGIHFMGMPVPVAVKCMYVNAEDDRSESARRMHSILRSWKVSDDERRVHCAKLENNLYIVDRVGHENRLTVHRYGASERTGFADTLIEVAQTYGVKLIILDPLSRFSGEDENDNVGQTRVVEELEKIRKATGATVLVAHHVSKSSIKDTEAGQEAIRGGSGLVDGARWVGLLRGISEKESKVHGVAGNQRNFFVRFALVKANYVKPQEGIWLRRVAGGALIEASFTAGESRGSDAQYQAISTRVAELIHRYGPMGKRRIEDEFGGTTNVLRAGKKAVRDVISRAIDEGKLAHITKDGREVVALPEVLK